MLKKCFNYKRFFFKKSKPRLEPSTGILCSQFLNILIFVLISLISRGLRFFIVSYLSYKFGDLFTQFMEKHGSKWFTIIGILIVIIGVIIYFILKFYD